MTIIYPLTMPTVPSIRTIGFRARHFNAVSVSVFTGSQQVQRGLNEIWRVTVSLPPMRRAKAEPWLSFLLALGGRVGTFLLGDPDGQVPRGSAAGTPRVAGAGQTGRVLFTAGWAPNDLVLKAGDYIQLGAGGSARLHKVLADAVSDGAGGCALDIWPRLREFPPDHALLVTSGCAGLFRMAGDEPGWEADEAGFYTISFEAAEAI
jgi:hypothetical protein